MQTFTTVSSLQEALSELRRPGVTLGFVPTMGALHAGHSSLIDRSAAQCDFTVASIFVNPTQFNESSDLSAYPRTPEADAKLLAAHGCDFLFLPDEAEIYPDGQAEDLAANLDFGELTERMEGAKRPGHFAGVAQVVSRLLDIVKPSHLFMGQKDYQQVAVVRRMVELLELDVQVISAPTVREIDGLALSSRNRRLGPDDRRAAAAINRHLAAVAAGLRAGWPARDLEKMAFACMQADAALHPEYVEVFDGDTLLPYQDGEVVRELVVACAVRVGPVRLIDNRIAFRAINP